MPSLYSINGLVFRHTKQKLKSPENTVRRTLEDTRSRCVHLSGRDLQRWEQNSETNDSFRERFQIVITWREFAGLTLRAHLWAEVFPFKKSKKLCIDYRTPRGRLAQWCVLCNSSTPPQAAECFLCFSTLVRAHLVISSAMMNGMNYKA